MLLWLSLLLQLVFLSAAENELTLKTYHGSSTMMSKGTSNDLKLVQQVRRFLHPNGLTDVIARPFRETPSSAQHIQALMKTCEIELLFELRDRQQQAAQQSLLIDMQDENRIFLHVLENCHRTCSKHHQNDQKEQRSKVVTLMLDKFPFLDINRDSMKYIVQDQDFETLERALNYNQEVLADGGVTETRWRW